LDVFARQCEGVVLELLPRRRIAGEALEETRKRLIEVAQGVLQGVDGGEVEQSVVARLAVNSLACGTYWRENP
jgi:hypothetical protein